ncbi:helix-turn-helix domain-containing protein [Streptomyces sp. NBC_00162]|uniref:helix-turn-helix domain-containing protein n=1 Tax=Streptomyces sp. NBC_00162 TaxID=2903629 RepID=UPI00214B0884|nr:helix-turn-helix transcriptional regulator [Streptomyces sp. NBC_00162]UUU38724.1 helix-turn-helix domain-containing protein [Streptomyces sp. NBC_00162]
MTRNRVPIWPDRLRRARKAKGLSQTDLGVLVGTDVFRITSYETGKSAPSPSRLMQLARVLECQPAHLMQTDPDAFLLADLRMSAGLTAAEVVTRCVPLLCRVGVPVSRPRLLRAERGELPASWASPDARNRVQAVLAHVYGVPVRAVMDAWGLTMPRPEELRGNSGSGKSSKSGVPASRPATSKAAKNWAALNARQRTYLRVIFEEDQRAEHRAERASANRKNPGPAAQWRRLVFSVHGDLPADYTTIQERLRTEGEHDTAAGSTLRALARRGLIESEEEMVPVPDWGILRQVIVKLTRAGRACVRAGLDIPPKGRPPKHLLSAWLWEKLVVLAKTGAKGLPERMLGKARMYLDSGKIRGGLSGRGFIASYPVYAGADDTGPVGEYWWFVNEAGWEHIRAYRTEYERLYPLVEFTTSEGEESA